MAWLVTGGPALLYAGAFGLAFTLLSLALGRRLCIWLNAWRGVTVLERASLAATLGAGVLQVIPFALGAAGALTISNVRIVSAVVLLAALPDLWAVLRSARRQLTAVRLPERWLSLWWLAALPGLLLALLSALTPTIDPDGLGYHLTVPKRWLAQGSLGYLPTYPYSNTPMGVEMLFTLGMAWAGDAAAKLVHFLLGIFAAGALYAAALRLAGQTLAILAVTLLWFGPFGLGSLMGWAYVEAATAAALIASGLAWLTWYRDRSLGWLRLAGLLAGIGVSFKMTAGLFPVALGVLTLALLWREHREQGKPVAGAWLLLLGLTPFLVLPVLPWFARSALVTGNPFFPMFATLIPSRDFTAQQSADFDQYNRYMVWGVGRGQAWGLGVRKAMLAGVGAAIAGLGVLAYRRQRSYPARATALVVLGTVLVQLAAAGLYKRYWIPALAVLQLPVLLLLAGRLSAAWVRPALLGLTGLLSLYCAKQVYSSVNGDVAGLVKTSLGLQSQHDFLRRQLPLLPLYERVNREALPTAGVMLGGYCGGFHIDRTTFCADIVQSSIRVSSWSEFTSDLLKQGVTHVIAPREWETPLPNPDQAPPVQVGNTSYLIRHQETVMLGRLMREHSKLLLPASDQGLYAIDLASLK